MKKLLTKREKLFFYLTMGVIALAAAFNYALAPVLVKNDFLNKEINLSRNKLLKYQRLLSQKEYLQSKYNQFLTASSGSLGQEKGSLVRALSELENLSKSANIRIIDIRPQGGASKDKNTYSEILIDVRAEGDTEGYLKFIYNLENSLSLLRIRKFQLSAKRNSGNLEGNFAISQLAVTE